MAEAEDQAGFSPLSKGTDTAMRGGGRGSRGRGKRGRGGRGGSGAGRGAKAAAASSSLPHSSGAIKKAPRRGRYKQFPTEKLQASSERRQEIQTAWRRYASISKSLLVTITDLQQHKIMTDPHFMAEEKVAINSQLHDRCSAAIHTAKMFRRFQVDSTDKELAVQKTYTAKACEVKIDEATEDQLDAMIRRLELLEAQRNMKQPLDPLDGMHTFVKVSRSLELETLRHHNRGGVLVPAPTHVEGSIEAHALHTAKEAAAEAARKGKPAVARRRLGAIPKDTEQAATRNPSPAEEPPSNSDTGEQLPAVSRCASEADAHGFRLLRSKTNRLVAPQMYQFAEHEIGFRDSTNSSRNAQARTSRAALLNKPNGVGFFYDCALPNGIDCRDYDANTLDRELVAKHKLHPRFGMFTQESINESEQPAPMCASRAPVVMIDSAGRTIRTTRSDVTHKVDKGLQARLGLAMRQFIERVEDAGSDEEMGEEAEEASTGKGKAPATTSARSGGPSKELTGCFGKPLGQHSLLAKAANSSRRRREKALERNEPIAGADDRGKTEETASSTAGGCFDPMNALAEACRIEAARAATPAPELQPESQSVAGPSTTFDDLVAACESAPRAELRPVAPTDTALPQQLSYAAHGGQSGAYAMDEPQTPARPSRQGGVVEQTPPSRQQAPWMAVEHTPITPANPPFSPFVHSEAARGLQQQHPPVPTIVEPEFGPHPAATAINGPSPGPPLEYPRLDIVPRTASADMWESNQQQQQQHGPTAPYALEARGTPLMNATPASAEGASGAPGAAMFAIDPSLSLDDEARPAEGQVPQGPQQYAPPPPEAAYEQGQPMYGGGAPQAIDQPMGYEHAPQPYGVPRPPYEAPQQPYEALQQPYEAPQQPYLGPQQYEQQQHVAAYNHQQPYGPHQHLDQAQAYEQPQQAYGHSQQVYEQPLQDYGQPQQAYEHPQQDYNQQAYEHPQSAYVPQQPPYAGPQHPDQHSAYAQHPYGHEQIVEGPQYGPARPARYDQQPAPYSADGAPQYGQEYAQPEAPRPEPYHVPQPVEPQPVEPQPTEPQPTEPQPTEPQPIAPQTQPVREPAASRPEVPRPHLPGMKGATRTKANCPEAEPFMATELPATADMRRRARALGFVLRPDRPEQAVPSFYRPPRDGAIAPPNPMLPPPQMHAPAMHAPSLQLPAPQHSLPAPQMPPPEDTPKRSRRSRRDTRPTALAAPAQLVPMDMPPPPPRALLPPPQSPTHGGAQPYSHHSQHTPASYSSQAAAPHAQYGPPDTGSYDSRYHPLPRALPPLPRHAPHDHSYQGHGYGPAPSHGMHGPQQYDSHQAHYHQPPYASPTHPHMPAHPHSHPPMPQSPYHGHHWTGQGPSPPYYTGPQLPPIDTFASPQQSLPPPSALALPPPQPLVPGLTPILPAPSAGSTNASFRKIAQAPQREQAPDPSREMKFEAYVPKDSNGDPVDGAAEAGPVSNGYKDVRFADDIRRKRKADQAEEPQQTLAGSPPAASGSASSGRKRARHMR